MATPWIGRYVWSFVLVMFWWEAGTLPSVYWHGILAHHDLELGKWLWKMYEHLQMNYCVLFFYLLPVTFQYSKTAPSQITVTPEN